MKPVYLLKLKWLRENLDYLSFDDYDRVTSILEKATKDFNNLNDSDLETIDEVYEALRSVQNEERNFG